MDRTSSGKPHARHRSTASRRFALTRPVVLRGLVLLAMALVLCWLTLAVTVANLAARNRPSVALAWWPGSATGQASAAEALVSEVPPRREDLARAEQLALAALRREPVNVVAARTLGIVEGVRRREREAERAFVYAEKLSRRDLPTQMILIEREVARNDIQGALRHYDRALTTSRRSAEILLPVLVRASADPNIARPLATMLARRPSWWLIFTERLIAEGRSPQALGMMLGALRLDPNHEGERPLLASALMRLAAIGGHRQAFAVYRQAAPSRAGSAALVRNGDFQSAEGLPPFDWSFTETAEISGYRQLRDGANGDYSLFVTTSSGLTGEVARQLLLLPSGRYRLTFLAGQLPADLIARPQVLVLCADSTEARLGDGRADPATRGRGTIDFTVSAARCPAQWISIRAGSDEQNAPWIDSIAIRRL